MSSGGGSSPPPPYGEAANAGRMLAVMTTGATYAAFLRNCLRDCKAASLGRSIAMRVGR